MYTSSVLFDNRFKEVIYRDNPQCIIDTLYLNVNDKDIPLPTILFS